MRYILSLITGLVTLFGNVLGGYWVWGNAILILVIFVLLDWSFRPNKKSNDSASPAVPNLVLILHVLLHTLAILTLLHGVHTHHFEGLILIGALLSSGLNAGISGIVVAHELIHRRSKAMRFLGVWNLLGVHYTHFYIEHIFNHHKNVGTSLDPATARKGESLYAFIGRTIPAQFMSALKIAGSKKKSKTNIVIFFWIIQLVLDIAIFYFLGSFVLFVFILQSIIAVLLLEYVNYIEHYGLSRPDAKKVDLTHSWQSNTLTSRITLLELSRHSDHHLRAHKPYHLLVSHEESPEMPGGYFGVFYICLIPSLWFKMIDPLLLKLQEVGGE